jgi:CspA family cold shock protein
MKDKNKPVVYDGTVLWFRDNYGYGFIECSSFPKPIFVHYSRIMTNETFRTLAKGQFVTFEVVETNKGLMATNVHEKKIERVIATVVISGEPPNASNG